MRKLFLALILGVVTLTVTACGSNEEDNALSDGVLTVGMECAYAPYNWTTSTKTDTAVIIDGTTTYCDGYDVQVAQTIADELGVELVVKAIDWDGLIPALTTNQIDAIIAGMSPTSERKQTIAFTDVYYRSEQVVVTTADSNFRNATTINGFTGANISAQIGTLQEGLIAQLTGANQATSLSDYPTLVTALNSGTIDGFIAELPVATQITNNNSGLQIVSFQEGNGFTLNEEDVTTAIGLRQSDEDLLTQINEALNKISEETRNTWMNDFVIKSSS